MQVRVSFGARLYANTESVRNSYLLSYSLISFLGIMMPGHPPGYYPPHHMPPGFSHSIPPSQSPYDHMSSHQPAGWLAAHHTIPTLTSQSAPHMWQPRPSPPSAGSGQKRSRRPSSKSSNGGTSEASFNSGLCSPTAKSPGSAKNSEKKVASSVSIIQ